MDFLKILTFVALSAFCFRAGAQNTEPDTIDLTKVDFSDLMRIKIATNKEQALEEAPSIVSVMTRKDIQGYGCRDISDVLRLIPGFEFGIDVFGIVGLGFRGIWVHEGKVLIMINGLALNDFGYGNYNYMGTIPVAMIERVEIIRGPGSAIHGGYAEVAVINIITVPQKGSNNVSLTGNAGLVGKNGSALNSNLSATGNQDGLKYNFNIGYSDRPLSMREYHDFFGNTYQMNNANSFKRFQHIVTELSYKGFTFNFNRTSMDFNGKDGFYIITNNYNGRSQDIYNYTNYGTLLKYELKVNSKFKITPTIEYLTGNNIAAAYSPLNAVGIYSIYGTQKQQKVKGQVIALYDFGKPGEFTIGGGYARDITNNASAVGTPGLHSSTGDTVFSLYTQSKYILLQHLVKIKNIEFTLGGRYENTSFGEALAPRFGITFYKNKFNSKLLYGKAYRIPTPWQVYSRILSYDPTAKLVAETSNTIEFEIGYKFNRIISAKMNTYYIDIDKPIVYMGLNNSYKNFGRIQSMGIEAELNAHYNKFAAFLNFSSSKPVGITSQGFLTADRKYFLGLPVYKINLGANYQHNKLVVGPTFTFLSKRYGESQNHALGLTTNFENTAYDPILLTNLSFTYKGLFKNWDINLSAYNLFDQKYLLVQPYYGAHAPLPANDRQVSIGIKLNL